MFKQRKSILILHFLNFLLNFSNLLLSLFDLLLVLQLTLIVVLNDLQLFQSLCQNFVFVKEGIQISSDRLIVFLQFFKLFCHLFICILFDSRKKTLLCTLKVDSRTISFLFVEGMEETWIICVVFCCDEKRILVIFFGIDRIDFFGKIVKT